MRNIYAIILLLVFSSLKLSAQTAPAKDSIGKDTTSPAFHQDLKEVKITARKRTVEQKIDRMIINVDASISNAGTSALEVLQKTPGVTVDKDGNISLKGKQGVTVMLDGRPTYLSGEQLATMLRSMESSQLDQIEIMTNPSAKYDAAGNSGIINIKTKKNKLKGFNGNLSIGGSQGKYFRTNESLSLNYRNNKFNFFSTYSFGHSNNYETLELNRVYTSDQQKIRAVFDQNSLFKKKNTSHNLKIGMDYNLDSKTIVGIVATGSTSPQRFLGTNRSFLKNPSMVTDTIVDSYTDFKENWRNATVNLNMRHTYDTTGRELTADVDLLGYKNSNLQNFRNLSYNTGGEENYDTRLEGDLPMNITILSGKVDYVHPIKDGKFELGVKSSRATNDSKAQYYNIISEKREPDYSKTNFYTYKENINAAYLNFNKKLSKKFSVQAGLRFENTNYSGLQYGNATRTDSSFKRSYNGLFPTIFTSYSINEKNQLTLSAGRRIDRPNYEDMNPFMFFIDQYTYFQGNPYLKPQYTNNIELSHLFKGMLTTTVNYSQTKNFFSGIFSQSGDFTTIQTRGNIGKRDNAGISMSLQLPVGKWLNSSISGNYNYTILQGIAAGEEFRVEAGNFNGNINNQFTFAKGWTAELSGWYMSKGIEGQIILKPMGMITAGVGKQIMKEKGTLKLSMRDIFFTGYAKGNINFNNTFATFTDKWDSRVVNLTFTYRFGKIVANAPSRHERTPEEKSRVKSPD